MEPSYKSVLTPEQVKEVDRIIKSTSGDDRFLALKEYLLNTQTEVFKLFKIDPVYLAHVIYTSSK